MVLCPLPSYSLQPHGITFVYFVVWSCSLSFIVTFAWTPFLSRSLRASLWHQTLALDQGSMSLFFLKASYAFWSLTSASYEKRGTQNISGHEDREEVDSGDDRSAVLSPEDEVLSSGGMVGGKEQLSGQWSASALRGLLDMYDLECSFFLYFLNGS